MYWPDTLALGEHLVLQELEVGLRYQGISIPVKEAQWHRRKPFRECLNVVLLRCRLSVHHHVIFDTVIEHLNFIFLTHLNPVKEVLGRGPSEVVVSHESHSSYIDMGFLIVAANALDKDPSSTGH